MMKCLFIILVCISVTMAYYRPGGGIGGGGIGGGGINGGIGGGIGGQNRCLSAGETCTVGGMGMNQRYCCRDTQCQYATIARRFTCQWK